MKNYFLDKSVRPLKNAGQWPWPLQSSPKTATVSCVYVYQLLGNYYPVIKSIEFDIKVNLPSKIRASFRDRPCSRTGAVFNASFNLEWSILFRI